MPIFNFKNCRFNVKTEYIFPIDFWVAIQASELKNKFYVSLILSHPLASGDHGSVNKYMTPLLKPPTGLMSGGLPTWGLHSAREKYFDLLYS